MRGVTGPVVARRVSAVTPKEIANLEHASRSALAWVPDSYDGRSHAKALVTAFVPAFGILAACATLLLVVL
jgi:hypothetical protein